MSHTPWNWAAFSATNSAQPISRPLSVNSWCAHGRALWQCALLVRSWTAPKMISQVPEGRQHFSISFCVHERLKMFLEPYMWGDNTKIPLACGLLLVCWLLAILSTTRPKNTYNEEKSEDRTPTASQVCFPWRATTSRARRRIKNEIQHCALTNL